MYHADWRRAVQQWQARPKIANLGNYDSSLKIDWVAHEKTAEALEEHRRVGERGKVFVLFGAGHGGKSVSGRWLQDLHALRGKRDIIPAFITAAEFADFGSYRNKAVKLVEALRGVRKAYSNEYSKEYDETYEVKEKTCVSMLDGICGDKLPATETFALLSVIEACTDRCQNDLIITTPQSTVQAFIAQLAVGENANGIVGRLNEQAVFIEYRTDRAGYCPWSNEDSILEPPYALPANKDDAM